MRLAGSLTGAILLVAGSSPAISAVASGGMLHRFDAVSLDRRGRLVASIEGESPPDTLALTHQRVVVRSTALGDERAERIVAQCDDCSYTGVDVSTAGDVAFLVRGQDGRTSVMVTQGGRTRTIARIEGLAGAPQWSPDGRTLALLVTIGPRKETGPTQAGARAVGEQGGATDRRRLALISAQGGDLRFVGPADMFVYEVDWRPDGSGLIGIATTGDGDNDWYDARLYAFTDGSREMRQIARPERQMMNARVSPDGRQVAFLGGLMSDFNIGGGDVYTVPIDGGSPVDVTPGIHASLTSLQWRGASIVAAGIERDAAVVIALDPRSGRRETLWTAPAVNITAAGSAFSRDGEHFAAVGHRFDRGPELMAGKVPAIRTLTGENRALSGSVDAQSLTWRNDGRDLQGWLLMPRGISPSRRLPMVVVVHGGPAGYGGPDFVWDGWRRSLVDRGYALFYPNFRGSVGRGEAFKQANILDFGKGDLRDILTGVDRAVDVAPIDSHRIGITGFSYGGYMTMWAVTQTDRFKAAVAGGSVANWISYYGQNGIDKWLLPYFGGSPHDHPAAYNAASPINFVRNVKTPTFIYVGERDIETPPVQSREFWKALREQGVPSTFVIYPDEGHRLRDPANAADATRRITDWFERYMPPAPEPTR